MTQVVSIVVPVHNVEFYLDACLESIVMQDHDTLQVILVDDGSTDQSSAKCDEWSSRDRRITVAHLPRNSGSSVARNVGIDIATGKYITFVDSDDVVAPHFISTMLAYATDAAADIVVTEYSPFTTLEPTFRSGGQPLVGPAAKILQQIMCERSLWITGGKLYRRSLFERGLRFPVGLLHQDLYLAPRVFDIADRAVPSDASLYGYRQRAGSVTDLTMNHAMSVDLITICISKIEFARSHASGTEEFRRYLTAYLLHASGKVRCIGRGDAWHRNRSFRRVYRKMAFQYLSEMMECTHIGLRLRLAWAISAILPRAYRDVVDLRNCRRQLTMRGKRYYDAANN